MHNDPEALNKLELFSLGKPVGHMGEVLALDMFKNGTMDIYLDDEHYRMNNIWPVVDGLEITFGDLKRTQFLQFVDGHWINSPKRDFEGFISTKALMMALHDEQHKLRFVVFAYGFGNNKVGAIRALPLGSSAARWRPSDHRVAGLPQSDHRQRA